MTKTGQLSFQGASIPEFENQAKIIENKYYNKSYHFGISLPSKDWEMNYVENIDSLKTYNPHRTLLENSKEFVKMYRRDLSDTLSIVRVGIIKLFEPRMEI